MADRSHSRQTFFLAQLVSDTRRLARRAASTRYAI